MTVWTVAGQEGSDEGRKDGTAQPAASTSIVDEAHDLQGEGHVGQDLSRATGAGSAMKQNVVILPAEGSAGILQEKGEVLLSSCAHVVLLENRAASPIQFGWDC